MPVTIHLSGQLDKYTGRKVDIEIPRAGDVLELLMKLFAMFPGVRDRILDEHDRTRPYVNIFVNADNIRDLQGERTSLKEGDTVWVLPSVAGG